VAARSRIIARLQGQGGPGVARMWLVVQAGVFLCGVTSRGGRGAGGGAASLT